MTDRVPVFVHAADLHLGAPLRSLGDGLSPQARRELIDQVDTAFDNLINKTIELGAEFLVLAGDIYDGANREAGAQLRFVAGMKRLVDNHIRVYIVHGNHDPLADDVINVVRLPEGVTVFRAGEVQSVRHELRGGGHVLIAGISYEKPNEDRNLAHQFAPLVRGDARAVVGVLHTNVGGTATGHSDYAPCKPSDLENSPVDYWALGHVHKRTVNQFGNRFWAYPGNLQGRDAGESGAKGALVVPIEGTGVGKPQFLPLDAFRFETITVECTGMSTLDDIASGILARLASVKSDRKVILRVRLTGRSEAKSAVEKTAASKTTTLAAALEQLCAEGLNGGHIEKVVDQLLPALDLKELAGRDDLRGDLLRLIDTLDKEGLVAALGDGAPHDLSEEETVQILDQMRADVLRELVPNTEDAL